MKIPRSALRTFRNVIKKAVLANGPRGVGAPVRIVANKDGFALNCSSGEIGVSYRVGAEPQPEEQVAFPAELLARLEGADDGTVEIEIVDGKGEARWGEGEDDVEKTISQRVGFELIDVDEVPKVIEVPTPMAEMPIDFIDCLDAASRTITQNTNKYAVNRVQLRGKSGEVIATDTRQLLIIGGFEFPFKEDVLIPSLPVFNLKEFARAGKSLLGRTETHVVLQVEGWQFDLKIDKEGRYPEARSIVPRKAPPNGVHFAEVDVAALLGSISKMPRDNTDKSITLDWGPDVRARYALPGKLDVSEIALPESNCLGQPLSVAMNPRHLERLLKLGFRELRCVDAEKPLIAKDSTRIYLSMPLGKDCIVPPVGVARPTFAVPLEPILSPTPTATHSPIGLSHYANSRSLAVPQAIGPTRVVDPEVLEPISPIDEAEGLKAALGEMLNRVTRLIAALNNFRREPKNLRGAVDSLHQLSGKH